MARFKKRDNLAEIYGGLLDNLGDGLFPEPAPMPISPVIERAAKKHLEEMERRRQEEATGERSGFAGGKEDARGDSSEGGRAYGGGYSLIDVLPEVKKLSFISFGSGSSGNCSYVGDGNTGLLIDAGVDFNTVVAELGRNGIPMNRVKGILLTHDHSDHVRFVYSFVRKYRHMAVYCTPRVLNGMLRRHSISNRIKDYHHPLLKYRMVLVLLHKDGELLDGGDYNPVIVIATILILILQLSLKHCSGSISVSSPILKAVILLHSLVVKIFPVYNKKNFVYVREPGRQLGCLE